MHSFVHLFLRTRGHGCLSTLEVHDLALCKSEAGPAADPHVVSGVVPVKADVVHSPGPRPKPCDLSGPDLALQRALKSETNLYSLQCQAPQSRK